MGDEEYVLGTRIESRSIERSYDSWFFGFVALLFARLADTGVSRTKLSENVSHRG